MATKLSHVLQVKAVVPTGEAPVFPNFGVPMMELAPAINPPDYPGFDFHYRQWRDQVSLDALTVNPAPLAPVVSADPQNADTWFVRFNSTNDQVIFDATSVLVNTGFIVEELISGGYRIRKDTAALSVIPTDQQLNAVLRVRARKKWQPTEYIQWADVTMTFQGTAVSQLPPGPTVIAQPVARSFPEGVATTFTVDVASLFSVNAAALPATYEVLNQDGTALSGGWVLNSITAGIASITSPATGSGAKAILFKAADVNAKTASTPQTYTVIADPLPQVVSTITAISIDISQSGNFPVAGASVIADPLGEALTYSLRNADGTAPPAGYSYDGVNIAYPIEAGAVTRNFLIRAVETGPLGRTVDSPAFTFDRPALPVVIVAVAPVSWPENATTSIDIDVRTALGTDAAEDITIPATFTGKISKTALGSGVFRLTGTFANNEILSDTATYSGTSGGNPVQGFPIFKSIHNPPVDGLASSINVPTTGPLILDVVAQSDDPLVNLIVAGSATLDVGSVAISADLKSLTLTPESTLPLTGTLSYTLEATAGGPQTVVSKTINWVQAAGPQPLVPSISTQSTDGVAPPSFDMKVYWTAGDAPLDTTSIQFYDSNDVSLGTSIAVSGSGTMAIASTGIASFTQVAGFVGSLNYRLGITDTNGIVSIIDWAHTQLANPGNPPPSTIFPNTNDGKPIIQRGVEAGIRSLVGLQKTLKNKRQAIDWAPVSGQRLWSTNLKGSAAKIADHEHDHISGWMKLAPGETTYMEQPRRYQGDGHADLDTVQWSIQWDVRTGDTADFSNITNAFGWPENGTVTGIAGGQSDFINAGAPFTFSRYRFIKTLTAGDITTAVMSVSNNSGADIWVRYWFSGRVSDESDWETQPFTAEAISDFGEEKIARFMDLSSPDGRAARAVDMVHKGDYCFSSNGNSFVTLTDPAGTAAGYVRQGAPVYLFAKGVVAAGTALWVNVPMTFGLNVTSGLANGFYTTSAEADPFSVNPTIKASADAYAALVSANFDSIIAEAKIQYRLLAQEWVQNLVDAGYPDNWIFYLEIANEIWNGTHFKLANRYSRAVVEHLRSRTDGKPVYSKGVFEGGTGYIANLIATEFARVIAEQKPNQQVKFVCGLHTAGGANKADGFPGGWKLFAKEFPAASLPVDRLSCATTIYQSGAFEGPNSWNNNRSPNKGNPFGAATYLEYEAAYNAAAAISEDNLFSIIRDWYVDPTSRNSSVAGQLSFIDTVAAAVVAGGAEYLGNYEGSFADTPQGTLPPGMLGHKLAFYNSPYGEEVQRRYFDEFIARYPGKVIANYYKYVRASTASGAGSSWFEKTIADFNVVPTSGAAKAWYDYSRKGVGTISPPTNLDADFETANQASLVSSGWTLGGGFDVFDDGFGDRSLYSATEFNTAQQTLGTALQANAIRAVRVILRPDGTRTAEYGRLIMSSTGDYVALKPGASGALTLTHLGQAAADAVTTAGLNLLDGSAHDLTITHYAHATLGYIEVKRTSDNFVYGIFNGDTISSVASGASPHIDRIELRGKVYWNRVANLTGVTPPPAVATWDTPINLDYAAGTEAGFILRIHSGMFSTGAAHEFFQRAQSNGGDIRAYDANGVTRLPLHILSFNKTAGTCDLRVRIPGAKVQNEKIILRSGGDGTLTQPAASAQYGVEEVYQDFDLYTTDMIANHATSEVFTQFGGAVVTGPNGLAARGYDSQGVNAGDATTSTLTTNEAALSCGILFNRAARGGGGVGVSDTGFARMFHMQNGDDVYIIDSNGKLVVDREFSTTDGQWNLDYATKNAWAGFCYYQDGSTGVPLFTLNGANVAPTVLTAPVGTLVPGNTTLYMGNHNGLSRNWDGRLCEYWRRSAATTQAFHIAWQTMLLGLAAFASAEAGALTP